LFVLSSAGSRGSEYVLLVRHAAAAAAGRDVDDDDDDDDNDEWQVMANDELTTSLSRSSRLWRLRNTLCNNSYAAVTCEIKLFRNYFSLRRRPSETILFQGVESCAKLFQKHFSGLLQLTNIFQHVQRRWNNFEEKNVGTLSVAEIILFQFQTWLHVK